MKFPSGVKKNETIKHATKNEAIKSKDSKKKNLDKANLGMNLEEMINESNTYYLVNDIAVIHKKPTPIQIVKVDYPSRTKAVITEAYYKTPSTTDYNGLYKGKYIDFDAKENHNKTAFPLANIHPHQVNHLRMIAKHGGIAFMIISFNQYNEFYFVPIDLILEYWDKAYNNGERKSIPYSIFKENCHLIKEGYMPRLNYLKTIDELYFNNDNKNLEIK